MHIRNTIRTMTLCALTMSAAGCLGGNPTEARQREDRWRQANAEEMTRRAQDAMRAMVYIKHPRTNLCFGYLWQTESAYSSKHGGPALVHVPCTPEVEALLVPQAARP